MVDKIQIGMTASCLRVLTKEDVMRFSNLSGDYNPIHLDEDYAKSTSFGRNIVHGMLPASLFSALFATQLPGPGSIYISQSVVFKAPVFVGDSVQAIVEVISVNKEKRRATFKTTCHVESKLVIDGEAELLVPMD